ncbi:MAG TPA: hypothetical protein VGM60_17405, partial [Pseudonocardia sp.]
MGTVRPAQVQLPDDVPAIQDVDVDLRLGPPDGAEPLWRAAHQRLSSGQPVSAVQVGPLSDEQRGALADLLGLSRLPPEHTSV